MRIRSTLYTLILINLYSLSASAQDYNSYKRQQQEAFNQYRKKSQEEFEEYRRKVNAEFAEFLGKPWEEKKGEKPVAEPAKEPDVPPVVLPVIDIDIPEDNPIDVNVNFPKLNAEPKPLAPVPYRPKAGEKAVSFTFYGTLGSVRFDISKIAHLKGADEEAVSRFWKELSAEAYDNVVADCQNIRYDRDMCDWAYYKMTEKLAEALYNTRNERAVFHAWLLTQSGFSMRLGKDRGNIYLLPGTSAIIFGKPFWKMSDGYYTLMDDEHLTAMSMMDVTFPETSPMRLRMTANNVFVKKALPTRTLVSGKYPSASAKVSCDKNLLAFLEDYPITALEGTSDTDYLVFADVDLSESSGGSLLRMLYDQVAGKSEADAANIILNFVQTAFEYKTDDEVWGYERPFFPEETLYYPYCDCEDRAILFCRLIRNVLRLETTFVSYPGHLAAAVHFTEDIPGDFFLVNGKRYLVCDPTYINAPIGLTMPGMNNATAQVYVWE